ncbi:MAG: adenine deaminase [Desulfobacteraceae bacterium]|nr:adenine deaminase [Desulfobacteraceae bacterium]
MDTERLTGLIEAARGSRQADLCLKGCSLVNVLSGRIETLDLAVHDGLVAGLGSYEGEQTIEAEGMYVCPGFIDGHIHIESSMLSPANFSASVLPWGTSAVVADPHEIANVLGLEGIRYFLECARNLPLDIFLNLPSCVPCSHLETSGATLRAVDLHSLLPHPNLLGLAEMMNFPGVLFCDPQVTDKLLLFGDGVIDGHAPMLGGRDLNGYIAAGIRSDHECTSADEASEKLSRGMAIMIRQGSQSKDLPKLIGIVNDSTWPRCMFVSDDVHPDDILRKGHMNAIVNQAMVLGMDPVRALTLGTWTAANHFGLPARGALAPGFLADFSISPTLNPWNPVRVFRRGVEVARDGRLLVDPRSWPVPKPAGSPMQISRLVRDDLLVPVQEGKIRVIGVQEGTLLTRKLLLEPKTENGFVVSDVSRDILKAALYNRYVPDTPPALGFVNGLGLSRGAVATSVAHDSHNVLAVGVTDEDILAVVSALRKSGGGMAVGEAGGEVETLPLPIAGLMSTESAHEVSSRLERLKEVALALGSRLRSPFMALSFLALPVIPELKITDLGIVEVSRFAHVPLFEKA